ncbi:MAG: GPW/gp25 family protein [Limnochordia bacterium]
MATREGLDNFVQALRMRLSTEKGELWSHPDFGVRMRRFIKAANTPLNRMDVEAEVTDAIEADPRTIPGSATVRVVEWDLKRIVLEATCRAVGIPNPINLVIGFGLDQITVDVVFRK